MKASLQAIGSGIFMMLAGLTVIAAGGIGLVMAACWWVFNLPAALTRGKP